MSTSRHYYNSQSYVLPQELTGLVMENLADDLPSLSASSLVCRSWSKESSRYLFWEIEVAGPPGMDDDLLELVKNSERVRRNVRSLHLAPAAGISDMFERPEDYQTFSLDKLLQILDCLPKINKLYVSSLRLNCDTEESIDISRFKSTRLVLACLILWNIPNDAATVRCYTQLLGSFRGITRLSVIPTAVHDRRSLPTGTPQPLIGTVIGPMHSSPLRIECLYIKDGSISDRYLEWLSNSHNVNIDSNALISFATTLSPDILKQLFAYHQRQSTSSIPRTVKFIESLTCLRFLHLDIGFLDCVYGLTSSAEASETFGAKLPDLSSLRCLETLGIYNIYNGHKMERIATSHRNGLRTMWELLMEMLRTTWSGLEEIHLDFTPYSCQCQTDFLHDTNPMSASRQVYDWSLLGKLAAERKSLEYIVFSACGTPDDLSDYDPRWWDLGSKVSGVWRHYPNTVRLIQDALPKIARFHTESED